MTPAEEAVLAAARAFRDTMANAGYTDETIGLGNALLTAARSLTDAAGQPDPTVATARPWPDPEAYRALACVFVIKPLDPSRSLPPGTNLSALFGVDIVGVLE